VTTNVNGVDQIVIRKIVWSLISIPVICSALWAKPKLRVYAATPEQLFQAALQVAKERHVVTFVDDKDLVLTFETGNSFFSHGYVCNASVEPGDERGTSVLIINVQKKQQPLQIFTYSAGDRMADKFALWVDGKIATIIARSEYPATPTAALNPAERQFQNSWRYEYQPAK